ncbi:hypothetical protein [Natronoglomus mannanivorans]|uniref:TM2 domain-containing protein n=1 Tax=Natronoglomus mannanivorans TaxID=2979990 RepID=A0AAP3E468_9EURY|nr:TM2 domain-containing protein [Halobacteria archaeon AArc-xg1-1]
MNMETTPQSRLRTRVRWPAYLLSLLAAGVGHWYLGLWKRGVLWLGTYVLAVVFLSARSLSGAFDPENPFVVTAIQFDSVAYADVAVPLAVLLVCLLDVYLLGLVSDRDVEPEAQTETET